ncbi:MAG: ATP-binding protein [Vicinamibacterales bacterium]
MTKSREPIPSPAKLLALVAAMAVVPLVALGWLGWRMLQQDRALEAERLRERLDSAASLVARDIDRRLAEWEAAAADDRALLPADATWLLFDSTGVVRTRGVPIPYVPDVAIADEPAATFTAAEALEFRGGDLPKACAAYRASAGSSNPAVRAGALMRWARCLRKQQRPREALDVYVALATMAATPVGGAPADLVARRERVELLKSTGDTAAAAREASDLRSALAAGRFRIDRATFDFYRESADWPVLDANDPTVGLADAVDATWPAAHAQREGRAASTSGAIEYAAVWRPAAGGSTVLLVGRADGVLAGARRLAGDLQLRLALELAAERLTSGVMSSGDALVERVFRDPALPWSLRLTAADPTSVDTAATARRNLFVAAFALMALVVLGASYAVVRAVNTQLAVARLKSNFVAAVSHEFRTPLTAMCHLTEMLEEGGAPPNRLADYYRALGRESRRLRTMVESLLDFGRIESGRHTYAFAEVDAIDLVKQVVDEARDRSATAARRVRWLPPACGATRPAPRVRADQEALALAVRNLVDNALKYSPDTAPVSLSVATDGRLVRIAVEDAGPGISAREQREIFHRFVRGAAARAMNVMGTGIGLAMASEIVKAHGGEVTVDSVLERGSTFTIALPALAASVAPLHVPAAS